MNAHSVCTDATVFGFLPVSDFGISCYELLKQLFSFEFLNQTEI
jgi:hypothetical protein